MCPFNWPSFMNKNKFCNPLMSLHHAALESSENITVSPHFWKDSLSWACLTVASNPGTQCITSLPSGHTYKRVWLYISFSNYSQTNLNCFASTFLLLFSQMTSVLAKTVRLAASSPKQAQHAVTSCMQHAGLTMSRGLLGNRCEAWALSQLPLVSMFYDKLYLIRREKGEILVKVQL